MLYQSFIGRPIKLHCSLHCLAAAANSGHTRVFPRQWPQGTMPGIRISLSPRRVVSVLLSTGYGIKAVGPFCGNLDGVGVPAGFWKSTDCDGQIFLSASTHFQKIIFKIFQPGLIPTILVSSLKILLGPIGLF